MKQIILIVLLILSGKYAVQAQSMGKGKNVIYLGVGAGSGFSSSNLYQSGAGYTYNRTPTFNIGYEHGISESIPQSIIGLGPALSSWFASNTYRDAAGRGWTKHWTDFTILGKGYYHHKFLVRDRWDVYGALLAGVKYRNYTFTATDPYYEYARDSYNDVYPALGIGLGARFYVTDVFGFYAELNQGYNINFAQIGFAFKF